MLTMLAASWTALVSGMGAYGWKCLEEAIVQEGVAEPRSRGGLQGGRRLIRHDALRDILPEDRQREVDILATQGLNNR